MYTNISFSFCRQHYNYSSLRAFLRGIRRSRHNLIPSNDILYLAAVSGLLGVKLVVNPVISKGLPATENRFIKLQHCPATITVTVNYGMQ